VFLLKSNNHHLNQTNKQIGRRFFLAPVALGDKDTVRNHLLPGSENLKSPNLLPLIPLAPTLSFCLPTASPCLQPLPSSRIEPPVILDSAVICPSLPASSGCNVLLQRRGSRHLKLVQAGQFREVSRLQSPFFGHLEFRVLLRMLLFDVLDLMNDELICKIFCELRPTFCLLSYFLEVRDSRSI
jgi:hypothetical protein